VKGWVVDASVAVKWVLPPADEPLIAEAVQLLDLHTAGHTQLLVPDLFWVECANVLWKAVRKERCSQSSGISGLATLGAYNIITFGCKHLVEPAFRNAASFNCSVYDSLYVALAAELGVPLVTADQKLVNVFSRHFSVKWLGAV
jgi:predicted nucleic acid-binding protein